MVSNAFIRQVRTFDDLFGEEDITRPVGLAFSARADQFLSLGDQGSLNFITPSEDIAASSNLPNSIKPINTAFDPQFNRLLGLNPSGNRLVVVEADSSGNLTTSEATEFDFRAFGVQNARGITVAPDGTLYILDGAAQEIVTVEPSNDGSFEEATVTTVRLSERIPNARGIAIDPDTGNLHTISPSRQILYEISPTGEVLFSRDISELNIGDSQGLVFAPTSDTTDSPQELNLYVADSDANSAGIVELSFAQLAAPATSNILLATLVNVIDTSLYPSPDPAGITFIEGSNRLLISDSEINEIPTLFTGDNLFETSLPGSLLSFGSTIAYSNEPTGLTTNPANGHVFVADDVADEIFEIDPGADGSYGTGDDILVNSFDTRTFGSFDPEGVAFVSGPDRLFIADGVNNEIYEVTTAGVLQSQFDTTGLGLEDPEGIVYNPDTGNLLIVGDPEELVFEITTSGALVQIIDLSVMEPEKSAGIVYAPNSQDPSRVSIYVADRGIDNNVDPNENDGKIYEFSIEFPPLGIYVTTNGSGSVSGFSFRDEDILLFNANTGNWFKYFDGGDVGLANSDIDAFHIDTDGSILLSLQSSATIPDVGSVDDSDIVRFNPTSVGDDTAGTYELFFDGSDVELTTSSEDIDAMGFLPDGRLVISTSGNPTVSGVSAPTPRDEDLLVFNATSFGSNTSGTWELYLDGSDVSLNNSGSEDVKGVSINDDGDIALTTAGAFGVSGVSGDGADIFNFEPSSTGSNTSGTFSSLFDGSANGLAGEVIDGFSIV